MIDASSLVQNSGFGDEEMLKLKLALAQMEAEVEKFKRPPLVVCDVRSVNGPKAVISLSNNNTFLVGILENLHGQIKAGDRVLAEQRSLTIVEKLDSSAKHFTPESFMIINKPSVRWSEVGGLWNEMQELQEVIELPLKNPELFKTIGIEPPKGVLLYGPPGCGKTLLAKAIANSTKAAFFEIVGSELVHKYIGDGAKLVKEIFQLAREKAPSIIFIDEIDSIASQRMEADASAEREVQRTFMQLLAEIDGFKSLGDVRIIAATNRFEMLDPALLRPGRLDRLVDVSLPNEKARHEIFKIHMKGMNLKRVRINDIVKMTAGFSGADIKLTCTEAGYFAIRSSRTEVQMIDFLKAIEKVRTCDEENTEFKQMFG